MPKPHPAHRPALRHAAAALLLSLAAATAPAQAQAVRPEIGKPLQEASNLLKAGKAREALAEVRKADAAANKTPAESLLIERMRAAAAQRAGDNTAAIQAFEAIAAKASGAEAAQAAEQLAFAYSQAKDWARTTQWIQKAQAMGSTSGNLKQLQAYVQAQSGASPLPASMRQSARDASTLVSRGESQHRSANSAAKPGRRTDAQRVAAS